MQGQRAVSAVPDGRTDGGLGEASPRRCCSSEQARLWPCRATPPLCPRPGEPPSASGTASGSSTSRTYREKDGRKEEGGKRKEGKREAGYNQENTL